MSKKPQPGPADAAPPKTIVTMTLGFVASKEYAQYRFETKLSPVQAAVARDLLAHLRGRQAKLADGKTLVKTVADVFKYVLDQAATQLPHRPHLNGDPIE